MYLPTLDVPQQSRIMTETFGGYNHNLRINDGEWYDEKNLSASHYPLFSQRPTRGVVKTIADPQGMLAKDALMYVDGETLYYNDLAVDGITLSTDPAMCPKTLVSMGAYAVIFPDKVYVNTKDLTDVGSIDAAFTTGATATITYSICRMDGVPYENIIVSSTAPSDPDNGAYWLDTGSNPHTLKLYSSGSGSWAAVPTVYVKIEATGIGTNFADYDGLTISGAAYSGEDDSLAEQIEALNGDKIVYKRDTNYLVVAGFLDQTYTQETGAVTAERKSPDMDFVTESNNRLWGCKYGIADGQTVNEIYACKQGDFKNWRCYMGLSTDSYAVSLGTDGIFTGAVTYQGYPLFFKETCIHKVYGSQPSEYQLLTTMCRGVQEGSAASLAIVNEVLMYKSRTDVCAFDGSMPAGISDQFGNTAYSDAVGGTMGGIYYLSMRDAAGAWTLFTYDAERGIWHKQDDLHALCFADVRGDLLCIDEDGRLISLTGESGTLETAPVEWFAESGIMLYEEPDQKYVSRYNIRAKLATGAKLTLYVQYDSEGAWEKEGVFNGNALTGTITIPVMPRRCDHLRLKLAGVGDVKIFSIARILENGGDQSWR